MRGSLLALALLGSINPAFSQDVVIPIPGVPHYQRQPGYEEERPVHRRPNCRALRAACEHKYERGEEGHGNCARYREACGD